MLSFQIKSACSGPLYCLLSCTLHRSGTQLQTGINHLWPKKDPRGANHTLIQSDLVWDFKSGAGFQIRCGIGKSKVHVESRSTAFSHAHLQLPAPTNCGQKRNPRRNSSSQSHVRFNQIWDWLEFSHLSVVSVDSVDFPNLISFLRWEKNGSVW